jgi:outer membrane protein TolC
VQRGIDRQREFTRQQIERRVRTVQRRLEASYPSIDLLQKAAENAGKNLEVVQEKYAQGILNVTDLLSAQNQAFQADQRAAAAVYTFLIDTEELQRSFAWFFRDHTPEENDELARRIRQAYGLE